MNGFELSRLIHLLECLLWRPSVQLCIKYSLLENANDTVYERQRERAMITPKTNTQSLTS